MRNSNEWFSANELAGKSGLPTSPQGVNKKARTQGWRKRNKDGVQGGAVEYHYSSLPIEVQRELGFTPQKEFTTVPSVESEERVPVYDAKASAGFGAFNSDIYTPSDYIGLSKQWIDSRGLYRDSLAFIMAVGDSMYPTINDGDMLLINRNAKTPRDGKIYVIRAGDQLWVKRVQGIINGIRLISDNKAIYDPVDVRFDESLDFEVLGQVVFIGRDTI
ncbi:helix-turn-helix domain-containing protein [Frederiksenia canicola]